MSMEVANTILQQLGGRRFVAMTGCKNFLGSENSLTFSLPKIYNGINKVRITLMPNDLYKMEFMKFNRKTLDIVVVSEHNDVYWDQLQDIFTNETGLATHL